MPSPIVQEMMERLPAKSGCITPTGVVFSSYDVSMFSKATVYEFLDEWRRLIPKGIVLVYWLMDKGVQFIIAVTPSVAAADDRG